MKIAYVDCFSGISGDMFIGALLDAGLDLERLKDELAKLPLAGVEVKAEKVHRKHIAATKFDVHDTGRKVYRHLPDLNRIVDEADLQETVKVSAKQVFLKIAEAEARCHGVPLEKVHFHEVGAVDTIIDVVGALTGLHILGVERVVASALNVGSGTVEFSHGKYPVPAPATADILKGVPVYGSDSQGELVTPTGAAIITAIAAAYGTMPAMQVEKIGYGAGAREMATPNVLRVLLGDSQAAAGWQSDLIVILETNIDDMNPEIYDHVFERLLAAGALDVYLTHIAMKKNRPGVKLTVLAEPGAERSLADMIFAETTSIGIRYRYEERFKLQREVKRYGTSLGELRVKLAYAGTGLLNFAPEYEDCKKLASQHQLPMKTVYQIVLAELAPLVNK
jgi:uncharacterized protein (TIGR00299 family) protein